ncbi:MAG: CBS domain-containing protein [Candidatus Helarchaeota archaeon]
MSVKIEDIMISDVKTLDVSSTVKDVVKEMDKNEIGSVIITKEG